jgi:hypothetical protein
MKELMECPGAPKCEQLSCPHFRPHILVDFYCQKRGTCGVDPCQPQHSLKVVTKVPSELTAL